MNTKTLTDKNNRTIQKGSIVCLPNGGHARVTAVFPGTKTVNVGSIFGSKVHEKGLSLNSIYEDEARWYEAWSQSERYMSM